MKSLQRLAAGTTARTTRRGLRNLLPTDRAVLRGSLSCTPMDVSDTESIASQLSVTTQDQDLDVESDIGSAHPKVWTKAESEWRAKLPPVWKRIVNGACCRRGFLDYLGENKLPPGSSTESILGEQCCNRCNLLLFPPRTQAPEMPLPIAQPRAGTRAGIALGFIDKWMTVKAEGLYSSVDRRFPMPACAYMDRECRWRLAHLYNERLLAWGDLSLDSLCERVRPLEAWLHWVASGFMLLQYLQSIVPEVDRVYAELLEERRHAREAKAAVKQQAGSNQQVPQPAPITASEYTAIVRRRDDTLATQVARREAWKAARDSNALQRLQQAGVVIADSQLDSNPHDDSVDLIPDSQAQDVIAETQLTCSGSSQVSPAPRSHGRKRRCSITLQDQVVTPSKRRRPLAEMDSNVCDDSGMDLRFTLISSSGRERRMTDKGKGNFRVC